MEKEKVISIFFQVAVIAFTLIVAFVTAIVYMRFKRNQDIRQKHSMEKEFAEQLKQSRIEVQEQTFGQIGKELHDNVGQLLSTSRMLLGLTERSLPHPPDTLITANTTLGEAINELRSLSRSMDKDWLEQFNFSENLHTEILRINAGNKVQASCHLQGMPNLASGEQIILFRIVQEAIQNALRHGNPTIISIKVEEEENGCCIMVEDNGSGFAMPHHKEGMGMNNMKQRTAILGGHITWRAAPGAGVAVFIHLPIKNAVT
ncbi:sensor histidine kinase [Chitinophaga niabensis]|uniref:Histidine kinase n=1 Tax=Chitinophaga niabensis TaxID=536979 RepID=A0A1N6D665_9BACT|nr:sensor histidine kinase [Chitinophaga niabensis]SIN66223.1 Histidine kinase [Chitinophaga niabensis]